jgi:TonB family protein
MPALVDDPGQLRIVPRLDPQPSATTSALGSGSTEHYETSQRKPIKAIWPKYPKLAELRRIEGDVLLELHIDSTGKVEKVRVVSGNSVLTEAAEEAARQWQYAPLPNDYSSDATVTRVRFNFKLNPETKR